MFDYMVTEILRQDIEIEKLEAENKKLKELNDLLIGWLRDDDTTFRICAADSHSNLIYALKMKKEIEKL